MAIATSFVRASGWKRISSRFRFVALISAALIGGGAVLRADSVTDAIARAERQSPGEAVETLLAAERGAPGRADLLASLSRAWSESVDAHAKKKEVKAAERAAKAAVESAERAVKLDPKSASAHLALSIACGKLTDYVDNTTKMALSRRIRDEARQALSLNPKEDLAHHILGRWNYGIATLNPMLKLAARVAYGALPPASIADAASHLERAAALNPQRIIHHQQLAIIYQAMKEKEKARQEWSKVMDLPAVDSEDEAAKKQARSALGL